MKFTIEVTDVTPQYNKDHTAIIHWNVTFQIEHENGLIQLAPTSVVTSSTDKGYVISQAAVNVIPGQIVMAYRSNNAKSVRRRSKSTSKREEVQS